MEEYFTYILESEQDGSWYYGQTNDLESRLERRNGGLEKYTKRKITWKIFWFKKMATRAEAMELERRLKNMKSRKRVLQFIEKSGQDKSGKQF